mmetsp:Transcript_34344/g.39519  ORF Transcript_34344/g.39519 Transcript_34344/m.39519 type:complete len:253 (+) Transcript_34344:3321-4079(+)
MSRAGRVSYKLQKVPTSSFLSSIEITVAPKFFETSFVTFKTIRIRFFFCFMRRSLLCIDALLFSAMITAEANARFASTVVKSLHFMTSLQQNATIASSKLSIELGICISITSGWTYSRNRYRMSELRDLQLKSNSSSSTKLVPIISSVLILSPLMDTTWSSSILCKDNDVRHVLCSSWAFGIASFRLVSSRQGEEHCRPNSNKLITSPTLPMKVCARLPLSMNQLATNASDIIPSLSMSFKILLYSRTTFSS